MAKVLVGTTGAMSLMIGDPARQTPYKSSSAKKEGPSPEGMMSHRAQHKSSFL